MLLEQECQDKPGISNFLETEGAIKTAVRSNVLLRKLKAPISIWEDEATLRELL